MGDDGLRGFELAEEARQVGGSLIQNPWSQSQVWSGWFCMKGPHGM